MRTVIYGPVPSWRLGKSLGIDLLSTKKKVCSFDCVYCQLGRTKKPLVERKEFVKIDELASSLHKVRGIKADYATFSGMGEPTLASNLGQAIRLTREILQLPIAVLTNSSLIPRDDVCQELDLADVVVAKLDAPNESVFNQINRSSVAYSLDEIVEALVRFRSAYRGKLALQMMLVAANKDSAADMARLAQKISPDEVQLNTPLRPCPVNPLARGEMDAAGRLFAGLDCVITVYDAERLDVNPLNMEETLQRRPKLY